MTMLLPAAPAPAAALGDAAAPAEAAADALGFAAALAAATLTGAALEGDAAGALLAGEGEPPQADSNPTPSRAKPGNSFKRALLWWFGGQSTPLLRCSAP
jgi:hypothetical protein